MKKKVLLCAIVIICLYTMGIICINHFWNISEYEIHQSIKTSADNYTNVILKVVVNVKNYDIDQMYQTIRTDYISVNEEPDVLQITLFDSMNEFKRGNFTGTKKFENFLDL